MNHLITSQLVEAHQQCPRKAFFLLRGSPEPHPHEYEIAIQERAEKRRTTTLPPLQRPQATAQSPQSPLSFALAIFKPPAMP